MCSTLALRASAPGPHTPQAASAYDMAKRIIRLVTAVGDVINK
jgi:hypothetical protein